MKTKEELLELATKELEKGNDWKVRKCGICEGIESVYVDDKDAFVIIKNHTHCYRIKKFERLSIFGKDSKQNTFENAIICNQKEAAYIEKFKKFCENFEKAKEMGVGMLFLGNAGNGKTFYTNCIANELKKSGITVLAFNLSGYLQEVRKGFDVKESELLEAVKETDLLIVDDIGNELLTDWGREKMFNLFNAIYMHKKSCIITTNLNKSQLEHHFSINDSNKIIDRIMELCKPFIFDWESRRAEIGNKNFKEIF